MGSEETKAIAPYVFEYYNQPSDSWEESYLNSLDTPVEIFAVLVEDISKRKDARYNTHLINIIRSSRCPEEVLLEIYAKSGTLIREEIIKNGNLGAEFLKDFYHRREGIDDRMLKNLCQNPALPIEVLEEIIKSGQGFRVSNHPRMTPELRTLFYSLSQSDQLGALFLAGRNDNKTEILAELSKSSNYMVRRSLAANPKITAEIAKRLAFDQDEEVAEMLYKNPFAPLRYRLYAMGRLQATGRAYESMKINEGFWWGPPILDSLAIELQNYKNKNRGVLKFLTREQYEKRWQNLTEVLVEESLFFKKPKQEKWDFWVRCGKESEKGETWLPDNTIGRYTIYKDKKNMQICCLSEVSFSDGEEHSYEIKAPLSKAKKGIFWNFSSKKNKVWTKTRTGELVGMAIVNGNFLMALWRDQKGIIGWTVELEGAASIPNKRELEYREINDPLVRKLELAIETMTRERIKEGIIL